MSRCCFSLLLCMTASMSLAGGRSRPDVMIFAPNRYQHLPGDRAHEPAVSAVTRTFRRWHGSGLDIEHVRTDLRLPGESGLQRLERFANESGGVFYYRGYLETSAGGQAYIATAASRKGFAGTSSAIPVQALLATASSRQRPQQPLIIIDAATTADSESLQRHLRRLVADAAAPVDLLVHTRAPDADVHPFDNFSTHVALGLRGAARPDQQGPVTSVDLANWVISQQQTGQTRFLRSPGSKSDRVVVQLHPWTLDELIVDLAAHAAMTLHRRGVKAVAIPDFSRPRPDQLGPYVLRKFKSELSARSDFQYRVLSTDWLLPKLQQHALSPKTIQTRQMRKVFADLQPLVNGDSTMLLLGSIVRKSADQIQLTCTPWCDTGESRPEIRGTALLTPDEWAMLGDSAVNRTVFTRFTTNRDPAPRAAVVKTGRAGRREPIIVDFARPESQEQARRRIRELAAEAGKPHPMADRGFPLRVQLLVDNSPAREIWSQDRRHLYVKLKKGDVYSIRISNSSGKPVFMRLLVDGLNTLPDHPLTQQQGVYEVTTRDLKLSKAPAQYANLRKAEAWYCGSGNYQVRGFFTGFAKPAQGEPQKRIGERAEFVVTDASNSEAWTNGYRRDVGVVTAAFYEPASKPVHLAPGTPARGTRLGAKRREEVRVYDGGMVPGELIAVVHLRYGIDAPVEDGARVTTLK